MTSVLARGSPVFPSVMNGSKPAVVLGTACQRKMALVVSLSVALYFHSVLATVSMCRLVFVVTWRTSPVDNSHDIVSVYGVRRWPTTVLVDAEGVIRARSLAWEEMLAMTEKLVAEAEAKAKAKAKGPEPGPKR